MNGKTDARIVKTMEKLKSSLLGLMKEHSIDSIRNLGAIISES